MACVGKWTAEEDCKLKDAVEKHNGKNWEATAALLPGRTKKQCAKRWRYVLDNKSDETTARAGRWATDEDSSLIDAVEKHKGKDWAAIAELVPGRTKHQCRGRWHRWQADTKSDETTARVGKW
jgi:myb proto-oncogene protein